MYTFTFRYIDAPSRDELVSAGAEVARRTPSRIDRILEIDAWCANHPGEIYQEDRPMARPPSPYDAPYFNKAFPVLFHDHVDEFMRAAMANALLHTHDQDYAVLVWRTEMNRVKIDLDQFGYRRSVRNFADCRRLFAICTVEEFSWTTFVKCVTMVVTSVD